jgi:hypothetical protein
MPDLATLRGLSGLSPDPAPLRGSALILIDLQQTYRDGVMRLDGVEPAIREAAELLRRARAAGIPVLHVRHDAGPGSPYDVTAPIGQISPEVAPQDGEPVITKAFPSAFVATDLQVRLEGTGVKDVVLAGFMTHMCVNPQPEAPSTSVSGRPSWRLPPPPAICPVRTAAACPRRSCRRRASPRSPTCSPWSRVGRRTSPTDRHSSGPASLDQAQFF